MDVQSIFDQALCTWNRFDSKCTWGCSKNQCFTIVPSLLRSCPPGGGRQLSSVLRGGGGVFCVWAGCSQTYADLSTIQILGGATSTGAAQKYFKAPILSFQTLFI